MRGLCSAGCNKHCDEAGCSRLTTRQKLAWITLDSKARGASSLPGTVIPGNRGFQWGVVTVRDREQDKAHDLQGL